MPVLMAGTKEPLSESQGDISMLELVQPFQLSQGVCVRTPRDCEAEGFRGSGVVEMMHCVYMYLLVDELRFLLSGGAVLYGSWRPLSEEEVKWELK